MQNLELLFIKQWTEHILQTWSYKSFPTSVANIWIVVSEKKFTSKDHNTRNFMNLGSFCIIDGFHCTSIPGDHLWSNIHFWNRICCQQGKRNISNIVFKYFNNSCMLIQYCSRLQSIWNTISFNYLNLLRFKLLAFYGEFLLAYLKITLILKA